MSRWPEMTPFYSDAEEELDKTAQSATAWPSGMILLAMQTACNNNKMSGNSAAIWRIIYCLHFGKEGCVQLKETADPSLRSE